MVKIVGNAVYAHKSNYKELYKYIHEDDRKAFLNLLRQYGPGIEVLKYDRKVRCLSLIESPDWLTANEPTVGTSHIWHLGELPHRYKRWRGNKENPYIYHCKWMFVADDYDGFDVAAAKARSELWQAIPEINSHKSLIGRKKYWTKLCTKYNIGL